MMQQYSVFAQRLLVLLCDAVRLSSKFWRLDLDGKALAAFRSFHPESHAGRILSS